MAAVSQDKELAREEELPHHEGQTKVEPTPHKAEAAEPLQAPKDTAVRFASQLQEIEPAHSLVSDNSGVSNEERRMLSSEAQEELRQLSQSITNTDLQHRRMSNFAFEPVSLPVSRVPSNESNRPGTGTPITAPGTSSSVQTPPLTPASSDCKDAQQGKHSRPSQISITPQTSDPQAHAGENNRPSSSSTSIRNGEPLSPEPSTNESRDESPLPSPGHETGTVTPPTQYSRPSMPAGNKDDPYARSRRQPQSRNLDAIDANFIFGNAKAGNRNSIFGGGGSSSTYSSRNNSITDVSGPDRKNSGHSAVKNIKEDNNKSHNSMSDLKRFFRFGHSKRSHSPAAGSRKPSKAAEPPPPPAPKAAKARQPSMQTQVQLPFADDHGLVSKYGKFGKVLGSGAGGSVRLMKRSSDGTTFAVKQFRERHPHETEREYNKKVTAEFCVGSTLHHGNIIETLDIIHENGHWYEVMEYAPFDLFAIVMTGKMSREEVTCCFLQIFAGVTYLHAMGLAHRDLKLDNVVVNEHGIMKIIDFGSATVFRYPFETDIVLASGIVGSDPYLAPEVYDHAKYDPQPTDVWSLAIIFACMTLRRFPWKVPRVTDNSYRLFILPPEPGTPGSSTTTRTSESGSKSTTNGSNGRDSHPSTHSSDHHGSEERGSRSPRPKSEIIDPKSIAAASSTKSEVIKGPWRLLRLLPRESRTIIGRMLEIDPKKRATIDDMLQDPWISTSPVCRQAEHGQVFRAEGHTHVLEPGSADQNPTSKK